MDIHQFYNNVQPLIEVIFKKDKDCVQLQRDIKELEFSFRKALMELPKEAQLDILDYIFANSKMMCYRACIAYWLGREHGLPGATEDDCV